MRSVYRESWCPNPGGQAAFMESSARVAALLGGYGSGKTKAGARKALRLAATNAGLDGMIVAPTWGTLHRTTLRSFYDVESPRSGACPPEWVSDVVEGKRYILLRNGSRIYYGSADRPGSLEGTNLAWWWLDEGRLVRRAAWNVLIGRLRDARATQPQALVTSTPAPGWMQEEFAATKAGVEVFHASTVENERHLTPGFIEQLRRTYSAREARVLIDGEFGLLVGAVLEEFEKRTHLVDWTYRPNLRTVATVDFGYRRPYVGFAQHVPLGMPIGGRPALDNTWIAFDEIIAENLSTELLARRIREKGYRLERVSCDPAGDGVTPAYGVSDVEVLRQTLGGGVPVKFVTQPRLRHIPFGIALLRGMLRNAKGETRFFVAKQLDDPRATRGIVKDFEGYAYPEAKDGRPVGDQPAKDGLHDHGVDGWRYFAIGEHVASGAAGVADLRVM